MNKKSAFFWLVYSSVLFLAIVTQRVERVRTGRSIAMENQLVSEKKARNDHFEFLLSKLKSPTYLIVEAKKRLNLDTAEPDKVFVLGEIETDKVNANDALVAKLFSD
jgi:hypothetical protein